MITGVELLRDITTAQLEHECKLKHPFIESMIRTVSEHYRPGLNFENILDATVGALITDEQEQHAYKYVLGKVFARRRHGTPMAKKAG